MHTTFCKKLKELRKEKHLSQTEAAKEIKIGLSSLRKYEQTGYPDLEPLRKIKQFYNVSYDYLLDDACKIKNIETFRTYKPIPQIVLNMLQQTEEYIRLIRFSLEKFNRKEQVQADDNRRKIQNK